jgi:osmotically-inducible protein OsmY
MSLSGCASLFGCLSAALLTIGAGAGQSPRVTTELAERLARLEDYSAFDWITFRLEKGTLTLEGFASRPVLRRRAEEAARKSSGVDEVVNRIETLPSVQSDDTVRIQAYAAIYGHAALARYAPGGGGLDSRGLQDELETALRLGLDGSRFGRGPHPIHIIVNGARVILLGSVRNAGDRQIAEAQVRTIVGVLGVANRISVETR